MLLQLLPREDRESEGLLADVYTSLLTLYCVRTKNISFGTKLFIFQFAVQEYKELDIQN
jgi:hypothetical protein